MTELLTAAQMRAIEQAAIDAGEVTGLELMERAGRGVVEAVFEEWPELAKTPHRAVVLCGPGNNGGDGFVVARLLKEWGWEVEVFLYGDPDKLPPDARVNYERWGEVGEVQPILPTTEVLPDCSLIIDALFGTGLTRGLEIGLNGVWDATLTAFTQSTPRVVSIDMPSGACSDSGRNINDQIEFSSDLAITFHRAKIGHYLGEHPISDQIVVKSIGIERFQPFWRQDSRFVRRVDVVADGDLPDLIKTNGEHKFSHGHALILSGGAGKTGAARLAARGALRIGAGVVTLGVPPSAQMEVAGHITAMMLKRIEDADALANALQDARINVLCLGPGLGTSAREQALILAALQAKRPTVLDADALSHLFFDEADALFGKLHDQCVLTPHAGEFARMFPDIAERLNAPATTGPAYSKVDATRAAAKRAGCVVLFKGPDTVIAAPDGRCSINSAQYERAAPWLATAGSGDVLAGFITGLMARGFHAMQAAETGAWLHVECARSFGPGLIAEDLPEVLPKVFRDLGL